MSVDVSPYALCTVEDVADLLGYTEGETDTRRLTIVRSINSASRAIPRRAQREFFIPSASRNQTRWFEIVASDVARGYVRVGDMRKQAPDIVKLWSADRDDSATFASTDFWTMPDNPEPGFPWEYVRPKTTATSMAVGMWMSVKTDWGFPAIPDDIIQVAIGTSASWILNDVMKQTELARQQGRRITFESLIPAEFLETVDDFRLYRVA